MMDMSDYYLFGAVLCIVLQLAIILILLEQRRRKRAEEQVLRESENLYRVFMENADDLFIHHTVDGYILYASPISRDLLGYEPNELLKHNIESLIHPDELAEIWETIYKIVAAGDEHFIAQGRFRHKTGHWIWAETKGRIVYQPKDKLPEIYCLARDITKRKQAEHALKESEKKFRTLFRLMPVGISVSVFHDGTLLEVNETFLRVSGYAREELIGKTSTELNFWVSSAGRAQFIDPLRQQGFVRDLSVEVRTKSGTILQTLFSSEIMQIDRQQCLISAFMDISELKRIEQELRSSQKTLEEMVEERTLKLQHEIESRKRIELSLRESEKQYRLIAENATDIIWTIDIEGNMTYVSPSNYRLSGYSPDEIIRKHYSQFVTPESMTRIANVVKKLRDDRNPVRFDAEYICKDGTQLWVEIIVKRLYDANGQHIGSLGISRDIRQRKQMEKALQQAKETAEAANSAKSMFLSSMSHELRTPLNAILGFAQLLSRDTALSTVQRDYLRTINHSGEHLLRLINDVLDMSRIEAGRMSVHPERVDLWRMLSDIEEMIRIRAEQQALQFDVERSPELPRCIMTDESKLRQALINLLGNAVKFTEQGRIVLTAKDVTAAYAGEGGLASTSSAVTLQFSIADTGPGIASDELATIFTPFHQASCAQGKEGSGLGLALSRKFVQLLGGDIQVESEIGQGSCFIVTIQAEELPDDEMPSPSPRRTISGLASSQMPVRILVVDDHAASRHLIRQLLGKAGFEVKEAANGQEALALQAEWLPDLILMDMLMPLMDGYEATRKIREMEEPRHQETGPQRRIPIIALTANVFEEDQQNILEAGCDAILRKPTGQSELFELIQTYLDIRYEYTDAGTTVREAPRVKQQTISLTPENLAELPNELLKGLEQAVIGGNQDTIMQAVEAIQMTDTALAEKIVRLAQDFKYQSIWNMIQQMKANRKEEV